MSSFLQSNGANNRVHCVSHDEFDSGGGEVVGLYTLVSREQRKKLKERRTNLPRRPPQNILHVVLLRQLRQLRLTREQHLRAVGQTVQPLQRRMSKRLSAMGIFRNRTSRVCRVLHQSQRGLQLNDALACRRIHISTMPAKHQRKRI